MTGRALATLLCGLMAAVSSGCAPYSFSGGRTALVASVTVPVFENQTAEFGLAEGLTKGIIDGFVQDNQIKVVGANAAEAVLTGAVVDYKRRAYTFDKTNRVSEYIVEIWVDADLTKKGAADPLWKVEKLRGFGVYEADTEDEQKGQQRAIAKIAEDLLNRTIKNW